jgi:hypothetical protein
MSGQVAPLWARDGATRLPWIFTPRPTFENVRSTEAASLSVNVNALPTGGRRFAALLCSRHFGCV